MTTSIKLSPQQAQQALVAFYQARQATLGKMSLLAIGLVAGMGTLTVLTGKVGWLAGSTAASTALLGHQALRNKNRDSAPEVKRIQAGLWNWLEDQESPDQAAAVMSHTHDLSPLVRGWCQAFLEQRGPLNHAIEQGRILPRRVRLQAREDEPLFVG